VVRRERRRRRGVVGVCEEAVRSRWQRRKERGSWQGEGVYDTSTKDGNRVHWEFRIMNMNK
jgi:hypothetical protein